MTTERGGTTLFSATYTRDAAGLSVANPVAEESWSYAYDELDQLLSATNSGNAALNQSFTYDDAFMTALAHRIPADFESTVTGNEADGVLLA